MTWKLNKKIKNIKSKLKFRERERVVQVGKDYGKAPNPDLRII